MLAVDEAHVRAAIFILGNGVLGLAGLLAYGENRSPAPALPEIQINGNRQPAGQVREGVFHVRLEVRMGSWHPEGLEAPGVEVAAFGVEHGPLPAPVPASGSKLQPARIETWPGETYDFEFRPEATGEFRLESTIFGKIRMVMLVEVQ